MTTNIEVKKAWYVTFEEIKETTGFQIEKQGSYGGTTTTTFYMGEKGWKEVGWGDSVVFSQEEAEALKKVKMTDQVKYLKEEKERTEKKIQNMEQELSSTQN